MIFIEYKPQIFANFLNNTHAQININKYKTFPNLR